MRPVCFRRFDGPRPTSAVGRCEWTDQQGGRIENLVLLRLRQASRTPCVVVSLDAYTALL